MGIPKKKNNDFEEYSEVELELGGVGESYEQADVELTSSNEVEFSEEDMAFEVEDILDESGDFNKKEIHLKTVETEDRSSANEIEFSEEEMYLEGAEDFLDLEGEFNRQESLLNNSANEDLEDGIEYEEGSVLTDDLGLDQDGSFAEEEVRIRNKKKKAEIGNHSIDDIEEKEKRESSYQNILKEFDTFQKELDQDEYFNPKSTGYPRVMGDYFLYDHMADGGMAKICRGMYLGEHKIRDEGKLIVIKMIKEEFSNLQDYIQMFMDEIHVAFNFDHPNVSAMFDYGKSEKNLYVSMEYIHGADLMDVIRDLGRSNKKIPIPLCIYIAREMCLGLEYVHQFRDPSSNEHLHIIHRDISPHNIMVSYSGEVKVIDFGIAKSDSSEQKEEEGTVKGKINYFAPEYLDGKEIDHRYDQFAVGLTLWEMLTGEKTFDHDDHIVILKQILDCNPKSPKELNSKVSTELESVVLKSLSKSPASRYSNMKEMADALDECLKNQYPDFDPKEHLGKILQTIYSNKLEKDINKFKGWKTIALDGIKEKIQKVKFYASKLKSFNSAKETSDVREGRMIDFGFANNEVMSVLSKGSMVSGLQLDMTNYKRRQAERLKKARMHQMAIIAQIKAAEREEEKFYNNALIRKTMSKSSLTYLFLVCSFVVLIFGDLIFPDKIIFNQENESGLARFRNSFRSLVLKKVGYRRFENIIGKDKANLILFTEYLKEKFMAENFGETDLKYYMSEDDYQFFLEQRRIKKDSDDFNEDTKNIDEKNEFLDRYRKNKEKITEKKKEESRDEFKEESIQAPIPPEEVLPVKKPEVKKEIKQAKTFEKEIDNTNNIKTIIETEAKEKKTKIRRKVASKKITKTANTKIIKDLNMKLRELEKEENPSFSSKVKKFLKSRWITGWMFKEE